MAYWRYSDILRPQRYTVQHPHFSAAFGGAFGMGKHLMTFYDIFGSMSVLKLLYLSCRFFLAQTEAPAGLMLEGID